MECKIKERRRDIGSKVFTNIEVVVGCVLVTQYYARKSSIGIVPSLRSRSKLGTALKFPVIEYYVSWWMMLLV